MKEDKIMNKILEQINKNPETAKALKESLVEETQSEIDALKVRISELS